MRRTVVLAAIMLMTLGLLVGPATAKERGGPHQQPGPPAHLHMLLIHPEVAVVDGALWLVGFRQCVDLAGGNPVPNHAHHRNLHLPTGSANAALTRAGHAVVPGAPLTPWDGCSAFAEDLPLPLG
jgi:hypothetical protein